ncbi:cytochrome c oxidase subunit I [Capsicum annuum]|nr:cytochrome c oxidase subunit I [Capsicum annuum]
MVSSTATSSRVDIKGHKYQIGKGLLEFMMERKLIKIETLSADDNKAVVKEKGKGYSKMNLFAFAADESLSFHYRYWGDSLRDNLGHMGTGSELITDKLYSRGERKLGIEGSVPVAVLELGYDGEVRIRSIRILIGLGLAWFTRYWFSEELIFPLAKPFLTLPLDSYFVRTQSTEAFPTYVATCPIACSYFVFPLISHQIWCILIPSCYEEQRMKYSRFLYLSGSRFSLFLFLTPPRVVPNVWHFPYFMGATPTNSLMIKLQDKIYDHIMLTIRISFIPSVCSQVPVIVIRLPELRDLSVETSMNSRRFLMVFPLLTAALSTPLDIWCQIVAPFLISLIIELAIFMASIVQVREEGWTSGMRESGSIDKKEAIFCTACS